MIHPLKGAYHTTSGDDICTTDPFAFLRPFAFSCDISGGTCTSYCGYGEANTIFRIIVAIVTLIYGVLMALRVAEDMQFIKYWFLFVLAILWFAVLVADIKALVNASEACVNMWEKWYSNYKLKCNGTSYGT